ncbi:MAG TPA: transposase [Thermoanaerobaculia bacterium]
MENAAGLPYRLRLRLPGYSYQEAASYFVTICSHNRECIFGWCEGREFFSSWIGAIVRDQWLRTPDLRPGVILDEYQVMPNHFHAAFHVVETGHRFRSIVGGFKSAVTSIVRARLGNPRYEVWQRGSYDSVIRSERQLQKIRRYIRENPARWDEDPENPAIR